MKASDLIGKKVLRTRPAKTNYGEDGSYTTSVIEITAVTDDHIFYISKTTLKSDPYKGILNHYWLDDNWTEYKESSHESPPERARHNYSPLWDLWNGEQFA
jgi:hypothetical protein